ncbi:beta-lactamase family protein [Streptomyces sp. NBC_00249]|uniref:serine hydrolase domain-containing protein n=1 Tax=Streptomyces sp. NBC_00249 TaxID=2975690 RepID=UPI00224CB36E|nr:serine hydrolase domain-containing protein [Streptomyces sp. NBC_00249]MCX5194854.1 beta-lactamase family protein [Streptomyces sp. NBC_00249]
MTNPVNSTRRSARWISLAVAGAAVASLAGAALPASAASAAERQPAPQVGVGTLHERHPVDAAALAKLMAPDDIANGTTVRVTGPGVRFRETAGPVSADPAASVRIGSMTKMFTSTVVLQLVAEGRFALDTPIREILPETVPADWAPITVGQLLSHTSGLRAPCEPLDDNTGLTPERIVHAWTSCPTKPEFPVTGQQYNGGNYFLLGLAIEKATGNSYADEVQRRIARPLGLRHTYVPRSGDQAMPTPSLAAPEPKDPWAWAEGGMISNAPDLERFMKALLGGRLLPPAQQAQLFVKSKLPKMQALPYSAGGLAYYTLSDGTEVWGKTGSMAAYTSGAFATADGSRVVTYSFLPKPGVTQNAAIGRVVGLVEAAL